MTAADPIDPAAASGSLVPPDLFAGCVLLAREPFQMAPSEIDALTFDDFLAWIDAAERIHDGEAKAAQARSIRHR